MNNKNNKIHVGIGFVTGRKNFKNVLKSYLDSWNQSELPDRQKYELHLFVAYDLNYSDTVTSDYKITEKDIIESVDLIHYLGNAVIANEAKELSKKHTISEAEAELIFGEGYAMKRNAVLYFALKNCMDYLIFLDDDEYPVANIRVCGSLAWKGQDVLSTHIQNIQHCDMTHGHHCGYISPIPKINFNKTFTEDDFRTFIETISNDIITWESVKQKIADGGVTFAELAVIHSREVKVVKEIDGMKFISGANLGFNLKNLDKLFPFYNPPGARGEDTFLSTCIGECTIRKVPCYTFHDAYSAYSCLISEALPNKLKAMNVSSPAIYNRFLRASIGWIRYKPLLLYITMGSQYESKIQEMTENLKLILPKICEFFGNDDFHAILKELDYYDVHVQEHYENFEATKRAWLKVVAQLKKGHTPMVSEKQCKIEMKEG